MELETLEIFIEANTEKFEQQMAKVAPFAERVMNNLENMMGTSINKTEKNGCWQWS